MPPVEDVDVENINKVEAKEQSDMTANDANKQELKISTKERRCFILVIDMDTGKTCLCAKCGKSYDDDKVLSKHDPSIKTVKKKT